MIYYVNAIQSLVPNAQCAVNGDCYEGIVWHDERPIPSKEAVETEFTRLQAEYEAKEYQRDRAVAYPTIQEQLDLLYWDKVNGTNNWEAAIEAVKTEYPKP